MVTVRWVILLLTIQAVAIGAVGAIIIFYLDKRYKKLTKQKEYEYAQRLSSGIKQLYGWCTATSLNIKAHVPAASFLTEQLDEVANKMFHDLANFELREINVRIEEDNR
jgi:hypothetical protein